MAENTENESQFNENHTEQSNLLASILKYQMPSSIELSPFEINILELKIY